MLNPKIVPIKERLMLGQSASMTLAQDQTQVLWQSFGPKIKNIPYRLNNLLYSINIYPSSFVDSHHTLNTPFMKWAAVEVEKIESTEDLSEFKLPVGDYAVFIHKGVAQDFPKTIGLIYNEWLPQSGFTLADRPHFEILTPNYQPNDPNHEEEVWIPIDSPKSY